MITSGFGVQWFGSRLFSELVAWELSLAWNKRELILPVLDFRRENRNYWHSSYGIQGRGSKTCAVFLYG
jgi:hypothetical protein